MKQRIRPRADGSNLRLAADIGGTFTDIAVFDERTGKLTFGKALSTPDRLVEGINAGVEKAGSDYRSAGLFLHGSTIAINTMLERTGAKTALLITEGFRDIYEIGRINRPDAYNLFFQQARAAGRARAALRGQGAGAVPTARSRRRSTTRRSRASARMLDGLGIEATAILFLNCYANGTTTKRARRRSWRRTIRTCSSPPRTNCPQEYREFERCSTVVANAYIGPIVRRYIGEIDDHIRERRLRRLVPDRAVDRRPLRRASRRRANACACWNPGPPPA